MSSGRDAASRAAEFLAREGDPVARAAGAALTGAGAVSDALELLPDAASLPDEAALVPWLGLCADLRALHAPFVEAAAMRAAGAQSADGGFDAEDRAERLALSAMLGGYLSRCPFVRPRTLQAVGDFLAAHWSPDLVQGGSWANVAGYAHYFANAPHEAADEILQWCGRELERGFRTRTFGALETLHAMLLCDAHAIPGATLERDELVVGLLTEQQPDGGFGAPDEAASERLAATRTGLVALQRFAPSAG